MEAVPKARIWSAGNPSLAQPGLASGSVYEGAPNESLIVKLVLPEQKANSNCHFLQVLKALEREIPLRDNEPWNICHRADVTPLRLGAAAGPGNVPCLLMRSCSWGFPGIPSAQEGWE